MSATNHAAELAVAAPRAPGRARRALGRTLETLLSFALLVGVLEAIVRYFDIAPYVFPAPSAVARALAAGLGSGAYLGGLRVTLSEILAGFLIGSGIGVALGIAMTQIRILERLVYPYVVAIQTVPKVAIAPLMIVWFGFGIESKIVMVALTCAFPALVNTIAGMRAVDADRLALVRALCGSRWQVLRFVQLPSAMPYILAGLNTAMVLAIIGAIVAEFVGAKSGIGVLILQANFALDIAAVFALLVLLALTGILLNLALRQIEARLCFWNRRGV